jgi:hypothetical protein
MPYITMIMLLVVAAIHLLPLVGACGKKNLFGLYGVFIVDPNVLILLRHRAVLFGLLGGLLVVAALIPPLRLTGLLAGAISVGSFLLIAWQEGCCNNHLRKVFVMDIVAAVCLACGLAAHLAARGDRTASVPPVDLRPLVVEE